MVKRNYVIIYYRGRDEVFRTAIASDNIRKAAMYGEYIGRDVTYTEMEVHSSEYEEKIRVYKGKILD